jgi:tetratricopeptide (TPR) repeat protein
MRLREETLKLMKAKLGPDHPDTVRSMTGLANSYDAASRTQEAMRLREETLKLMKDKLGPDHPDTLTSMNNLALSYAATGRSQEALKLFEEALHLQKVKFGPDHPDTLRTMNNLANPYIAAGQAAKTAALLQETLGLRERRLQAEPGNSTEQSYLAWTHGQMGEAEQARFELAAAVQAYAKGVEMFEKLDQAGTLKDQYFRGQLKFYQKRLALCRKAEQAVKDLDFALQQPAAEVPELLYLRVGYLLKEQKLPAAVETAAKMKELAGDKAVELYNAACLYALCAGAAKEAKAPLTDGRGSDMLADEAMAMLRQAIAKGYKNASHMKLDNDLDALREREDYKKLVKELEEKK